MKWYELAENPLAVSEIYSEVPSLQSVRLVEVLLLRDGRRMTVKIEMPHFPDKIPKRWKLQGYTSIQIQLDFWDLQSLDIVQWSSEDQVDMQIEVRAERRIEVKVRSSQYRIQATAHDFRITLHKKAVLRRKVQRNAMAPIN
jgi:hypothetical protein